MKPRQLVILLVLAALLMMGLWLPASAAPAPQVQYATPTAGADGRILYIIQPGDTCIRVALLNSISDQQLRELNQNINPECTNLIEGQPLLIGLVGPAASPTPGPSPTALPPTVTPTPLTGTTEICVLLFNDQNGDALRQETEGAVAQGAISVTENNGAYSASQMTVINSDPDAYPGMCFTDVPEGDYNVSVALPDNYNPTIDLSSNLEVLAGGRYLLDFGAQSSAETVQEGSEPGPEQGGSTSLVLGVVGGLLLLGGAGLGWYAWQMNRPSSKLGRGSNIFKRLGKK